MKIAFDAKRYYHNRTGLGNYSRTIANGLKLRHPEVEQVLLDEPSWRRLLTLGSQAKAEGCHILHGLSNELPWSSPIPTIVTIHDVAWRTFPDMYHWADRQIYDLKYGHSSRVATKVIAISESTKRDVMRFYDVPERNIEVIYQPVQDIYYEPVDLKAEAQAEPLHGVDGDDYILYVGSINKRKNLLGLVKALEMIPKDQRPLLVVIGNGREYRKEVEQYVDRHGLRPYFTVLTDVHESAMLRRYYHHAMMMAYPSFYEGFGLPVVEASLTHCPVVTSNVSSLPEAAGPGALLCDPYQIESINDCLMQIIDDREMGNRLATAAFDYAQRHFNPDTLLEQVYSLYNKII